MTFRGQCSFDLFEAYGLHLWNFFSRICHEPWREFTLSVFRRTCELTRAQHPLYRLSQALYGPLLGQTRSAEAGCTAKASNTIHSAYTQHQPLIDGTDFSSHPGAKLCHRHPTSFLLKITELIQRQRKKRPGTLPPAPAHGIELLVSHKCQPKRGRHPLFVLKALPIQKQPAHSSPNTVQAFALI